MQAHRWSLLWFSVQLVSAVWAFGMRNAATAARAACSPSLHWRGPQSECPCTPPHPTSEQLHHPIRDPDPKRTCQARAGWLFGTGGRVRVLGWCCCVEEVTVSRGSCIAMLVDAALPAEIERGRKVCPRQLHDSFSRGLLPPIKGLIPILQRLTQ